MTKTKKYMAIITTVLLLGAIGCGSFVRDSYRTLSVSSATYEASMRSLADLYEQGRISEEQKEKVLEIGNQYWVAYHTASDLLAAYMTVESQENKNKLAAGMIEFSRVLGNFMAYVHPILVEGGK